MSAKRGARSCAPAKLAGVSSTNPESARVDPAATRRRLAAFVAAEPYKPELLAKVARLSVQLNEPAQAGRYWLLSDATGPEIDAAVEVFAESCQRLPRLMASELPRFVGDFELATYAAPALVRIEKYGLAAELSRRAPRKPRRTEGPGTAFAVAGLLALLVLLCVALVMLRRP